MSNNGHGGVHGSPGGSGLARAKSILARWDNLTIATREIREALIVELLDLPDGEFSEVLHVGLAADDPQTRRLAVEVAAMSPEFAEGVIELLADHDAGVRLAAVAALAQVRPAEAPSGLHLALRDPAPHVRAMAVRSLAVVDGAAGWAAADEALDDSVDLVREAAAQTLEVLARSEPVENLIPVQPRPGAVPSAVRPILTVMMPVYNEVDTLDEALTRLTMADLPEATEVVIVDDGSTDGSRQIIAEWASRHPAITAVFHERNAGKGSAIRTALSHATGHFVCVLDGDLEYNPSDIGATLKPLLGGSAQAVYGVRSFGGHAAHSFWYVVGNRTLTTMTNVIYNNYVRDMMTCIKAMRLEDFRRLDLKSNGFAIEAEITAKLMRMGVRIHEVPVDYKARSHDEGKKIRPSDAGRVLAMLVTQRLRRRSSLAPQLVPGPHASERSTPFGQPRETENTPRSTADLNRAVDGSVTGALV